MVFNSFDFLLFFLVVFILFWSFPQKIKWILLLASSCFFYMYWNPIYILLLLFSTSIDYFFALYLTSSNNTKKRKLGFYSTLVIHLSILFTFKYITFFLESISQLLGLFELKFTPPALDILLPLGISFYTFQSISYTIDVYRKTIQPEKNFGKFTLFILFFPQLVAGPIERAGDLLPQLKKERYNFTYEHLRIGLIYCLVGFFMKVVVADNLFPIVDPYFANASAQTGSGMIYATILFSFQVYSDFAGYSFVALGIAKLLDIDLMHNFKSPFLTQSLSSFWRSWHISLSIWTRDYIYIPLGGNRVKKWLNYRNLLVVFFIIGLWHGASYTFIIWGILNALGLILERIFKYNHDSKGIIKYIRYVINFIVVSFFMMFFRAESLADVNIILMKFTEFKFSELYFLFADNRFAPGILGILILMLLEFTLNRRPVRNILDFPTVGRYTLYVLLFFAIVLCGKTEGGQFIYFQF